MRVIGLRKNQGDTFTYRYILATSVVKDLVVLLDTGQTDAAFNSSKKIITELFGTIIVSDRVNVVTFNATDATLLQQTSVKTKASPAFSRGYWFFAFIIKLLSD